MNFTSDENNTAITTYKAGEACSFGITSVNYITSRTEQVTSGEDNTTIDKVFATYDVAAMKTNDQSTVYCIRNATGEVSILKNANGTILSIVGSGNMYHFTPSTVGEWTSIDANGGNSVNVPGFYYQESGIVETTGAVGNYSKIQGTFVDMCAAIDSSASPPAVNGPDASSASPTPMYSPKSSCESMGITKIAECGASCEKYFPDGYNGVEIGPLVDGKLEDPYFCKCTGVGDVANNDRYVCGATADVYFTCRDVNVTDLKTCDYTCKQDASNAGWSDEYSMCDCYNTGEVNYCGGPPPPPASGVLPTCGSMGIFSEDACEYYCRDYERSQYPMFSAYPGGGLYCVCSTGAGCEDEVLPTPNPTPMYSPKSTCESMGIINADECDASCNEYFPEGFNGATFGPFVDEQPQRPDFCLCTGVGDIGNSDRYVCGATADAYFTCKVVNVTEVETCDDVCKQDTSTPGTTFSGGWNEEHSLCECLADVPNSDVFNYCGGPPPPPASGVLPACPPLFSEDACELFCRDYMRNDYPKFQASGVGAQCLCSTGAGCDVEGPSSGNKLGVWVSVSGLMMLTTVMATVL